MSNLSGTNRGKIRQSLHEDRIPYHDLFEKVAIGILIADIHSQDLLYANPAVCHMLGYSKPELKKMNIRDIHPKESIKEVLREFKSQAQAETLTAFDIPLLKKDGTVIYTNVTTTNVKIKNRSCNVGFFIDVTEKKKSEEALDKIEKKYKAIFESTGTAAIIVDEDTIIINANKECENVTGYSASYLVGKSWTNFAMKEDLETMLYHHKQRRKDPESSPKRYDVRLINAKGEIRDTVLNIEMIPGTKKSVVSMLDVTEHKKRETKLKESEKRYRSLVTNLPVGIFRSTPQGKIVSANPAMAKIYGYDSEGEVVEVSAVDFYSQYVDRKKMLDELEKKDFLLGYETLEKKKDGSFIWVSTNYKAVRDSEGKIDYIDGVVIDITQRKKADSLIKKNLKEKEILLKEIHHRVKNNLNVITSLLHIQSRQIKNKEQALRAFQESIDRIYSMALVHENLYKADSFSRINMKNYIRSMTKRLISYIPENKNITIDIKIKDISLDINKAVPCGLILNEIVTNSLKHAFPEANKGNVSILFRRTNSHFELTVKDNGIGLPEDIDVKKTESLGLKLVILLTEQLDGVLEAKRENGTQFKVYFPAEDK